MIHEFLKHTNAFVVLAVPTGNEKRIMEVKPAGEQFSLGEVKAALRMRDDEYVEMVTCDPEWMFLLDEEGKNKQQTVNTVAVEVWEELVGLSINDQLAGNVIFMKRHLLK